MRFFIFHKNGDCLAAGVNEETTRKILRNIGPIACEVFCGWTGQDEGTGLNGVEWIIDNPGT